MIKRIIHGKIRITCRITLDQYHPSGLKALGLILMSRDDTTYDTDFAMYYSLYINNSPKFHENSAESFFELLIVLTTEG